MVRRKWFALAAPLAVIGALACSSEDEQPDTGSNVAPQCKSSTYVSFDSGNHANQEIRLQAHAKLVSLMKEGAALLKDGNASGGASKLSEAKQLYTDPIASANLREKVQGRLDEHIAGAPSQGDRLDGTIVGWLDFAVAASSSLEATVARQWVDKTLTEFLFLSVHHEIVAGTRKNWDEGFGYYGSGVDNAESGLLGLAATARKRDDTNGTYLQAEIYNGLIDGSCALENGLRGAGTDKLAVDSVPELAAIVGSMDLAMQKVLAYSVGHEAFGMKELLTSTPRDDDGITVKAAELIPFFIPLERIMKEKGGDSAQRAAEIRSLIDAMPVSDPSTLDLSDTTWIDALGDAPTRIIGAIEAEYGIVVKG
jgi:hypothetical protein